MAYVERGERGELLFSASGNAEDLRYLDVEANTEVSISAWELLNEDLAASKDMVLAPSEPIMLERRIKKKSSSCSPSETARRPPTTKHRSAGPRRGQDANKINAAEVQKLRQKKDPLRQGSLQGLSNASIPRPPEVQMSPAEMQRQSEKNAAAAYAAKVVSVAVDKHAVLAFGALRSEDVQSKRVWVGVASLRNDGNCAVAFRVRPLLAAAEAGEAMWQAAHGGGTSSGDGGGAANGALGSSVSSLSSWSTLSNQLSEQKQPQRVLPSLPQITPEYGVMACGGGKADIKFQIMQSDAAKVRALLSVVAEEASSMPTTPSATNTQPASHEPKSSPDGPPLSA